MDGVTIGTGTADSQGRFRVPFQLPKAPIGRHMIDATCGGTTLHSPIDLVVSTTGSTGGAQAVAAGAVLAFFVFIIAILMPARTQ
ncbi:MAG: hypothetical protein V7605_2476 [Acidimicrobiaceae bacterium]|jgi:hypothetical protein